MNSSADSLTSATRRRFSSSCLYRAALAIAWPAICARPITASPRVIGRGSRLSSVMKPMVSPWLMSGTSKHERYP